jgi:hypothetical protein
VILPIARPSMIECPGLQDLLTGYSITILFGRSKQDGVYVTHGVMLQIVHGHTPDICSCLYRQSEDLRPSHEPWILAIVVHSGTVYAHKVGDIAVKLGALFLVFEADS